MAQKITVFPKATRRSKYDTKSWFDGDVWKLTHGEDFDVPVASFRGSLYNRAKLANVEIKTTVDKSDPDRIALVVQKTGTRKDETPAKKTSKKAA